MNNILELLQNPWHWSLSGLMMAVVMLLLLYFGKSLGPSSSYRAICAIAGGGRTANFFRFNWKDQQWNITFAVGIIIGGFFAHTFMLDQHELNIADDTIDYIQMLGLSPVQGGSIFLPKSIFNPNDLLTLRNVIFIIGGGFLSGFGALYAGGCTSGHFITGLADLQIPSFITLIFFLFGGMVFTNFLLPLLINI